MTDPIPFIDLAAQQERIRDGLDQAIARVLDHGAYVSGPEVLELEAELGRRTEGALVVGCASGTDALVMALMAWGVGHGDAVLVPGFTFAATAEAVVLVGATPVFVDVLPDTFNMDPESVRSVVASMAAAGERPPVGIVPVDLFGLPADYEAIRRAFEPTGGWVLADAAQSFGAIAGGRPVGSLGDLTATSFFPAKPLGCYGDGGALFGTDAALDEVLRSIRVHGHGLDRYEHVRIGMTGRLDTIQAAVLLQKLTIFADELEARDQVARRYQELLPATVRTPVVPAGLTSAWAQYTVQVDDRDRVVADLRDLGVPTAVYYPKAVPDQVAYARYPDPTGVPVSRELAGRVLSLPMHPYLTNAQQDRVGEAVLKVCS